MESPADALSDLAAQLAAEKSVISPHIRSSSEPPALGALAAAGPRAAASRAEYAHLFESVREGYLLHYGTPRIVAIADADLALLAGDYLYALGLERLAALGDLDAVGELSDLISLSAQLATEGRAGEPAGALWLASAIAVGCGAGPAHADAKAALREGHPDAARRLATSAASSAAEAGLAGELGEAADAIDFALDLDS